MKMEDSQFQVIRDESNDGLKVSTNIIWINQSEFVIYAKRLRYNQFFEKFTDAIKSNILPNSMHQMIQKRYVRYICVYWLYLFILISYSNYQFYFRVMINYAWSFV